MGLTRDITQIAQQEEQIQANRKKNFGDKVPYFGLKDGEKVAIRIITDPAQWIYVSQHAGVKTKPGAPRPQMGAVCRKDTVLDGELDDYDGTCLVCDEKIMGFGNKPSKPSPRVWVLAVERQNVAPGVYADVMEEYEIKDKDGKVTSSGVRPKLIIINMAYTNFFAIFLDSLQTYGAGAIQDRDYQVTRNGSGTDTKYGILPLPVTPDLYPGSENWKVYENQIAERGISLVDTVLGMASKSYYDKFFNVNVKTEPTAATGESTHVAASASSAPAMTGDIADRMAAVKARMQSGQ